MRADAARLITTARTRRLVRSFAISNAAGTRVEANS